MRCYLNKVIIITINDTLLSFITIVDNFVIVNDTCRLILLQNACLKTRNSVSMTFTHNNANVNINIHIDCNNRILIKVSLNFPKFQSTNRNH